MDLSTGLNFGRLIRTFLPGFVALVGLALLVEGLSKGLGFPGIFQSQLLQQPIAASVLALPVSLICGTILNMVYFLFIADFARRWLQPLEEDLKVYSTVEEALRENLLSRRTDLKLPPQFLRDLDLDWAVLPLVGVEKLIYSREAYWYFMEYQLNLILSLLVILPGGFAWLWLGQPITLGTGARAVVSAAFLAATFATMALCILAAKKNYRRHLSKRLSLLVGGVISSQGPVAP